MNEALLVLSTFPDEETAQRISRHVVDERLAACANIAAPVRSIYRWKEAVEDASEVMVFFKTTPACYAALQKTIRSLHPYDVPEIVSVQIAAGLHEYLEWVTASCQPPPKSLRV